MPRGDGGAEEATARDASAESRDRRRLLGPQCPRSAGEGIKPNEYIHLLTDVYLTHKNVRFFFLSLRMKIGGDLLGRGKGKRVREGKGGYKFTKVHDIQG